MRLFTTTALVATALATTAFADGHSTLPLKELPGIEDRDHWVPGEVNADGALEAMQEVVGSAAVPFSGNLDAPVQIALIYPSSDTSDFWARNYLAMTKRLDELGITYETTEFASRQIEHSLQTTYANQVVQDKDLYDYVIFGPSELAIQADNITKLSKETDDLTTYVWAFHTPLKEMEVQPAAWFDFSSAAGALTMCDYMISRLGEGITMAMNRGIPGITDNQRSVSYTHLTLPTKRIV